VTLSDVLQVLQAATLIGGAGVAVWKIASTTGELGREIRHLSGAIERLEVVVEKVSHEVGCLQTRVAVIEAANGWSARE